MGKTTIPGTDSTSDPVLASDESLWMVLSGNVSRLDTTTKQLTHITEAGTESRISLGFDRDIWVFDTTGTITRINIP